MTERTVQLTGARDVAEFAATSETAHRAFIRHLFHHTVKQEPGAFGPNTLDSLRRSFAAQEFNIQKLLAEIAVVAASTRAFDWRCSARPTIISLTFH